MSSQYLTEWPTGFNAWKLVQNNLKFKFYFISLFDIKIGRPDITPVETIINADVATAAATTVSKTEAGVSAVVDCGKWQPNIILSYLFIIRLFEILLILNSFN